jgi:integrase
LLVVQRLPTQSPCFCNPSPTASTKIELKQIEDLLAFVKAHGSRAWMYPMCVAAAHTGARRSELVRLVVDDIDFQDKMSPQSSPGRAGREREKSKPQNI